MTKKLFLLFFVLMVVMGSVAYSQNLSQIGFIIKKAMPDTENIAVIFEQSKQDKMVREAQTAFLVAKAKFTVYGIKMKSDIPKVFDNFADGKRIAVILITDNGVLNAEGVRFVSQRLEAKNIPVITNRAGDTAHGAVICVFQKGDKIETHVSKSTAGGMKITFPEEFLATAVAD